MKKTTTKKSIIGILEAQKANTVKELNESSAKILKEADALSKSKFGRDGVNWSVELEHLRKLIANHEELLDDSKLIYNNLYLLSL